MLRPVKPEAERRIPPTDMIQADFDRPSVTPARTLLLILSTERSGSTLLCEQLAALDFCYAHEYFQASQYMQILARRWDFADGSRIDWGRFTQALRTHRTASNGVLGINLHGRHLALFERAAPHFADLSVRCIHVTRRDALAQAISFDEARQTIQWSAHFPAKGPVEYSYERLSQALATLNEQNARILAFLAVNGIAAESVVYEDLVASPVATLHAVTGMDKGAIAESLARDRDTATRRQGGGADRHERMLRFAREFLRDTDEFSRA